MKVVNAFGESFTVEQIPGKPEKDPLVEGLVTKAGLVDAAPGTWALTHQDGTVSLVHPTVFDADYREKK